MTGPRVSVVADVAGRADYHLGDEAMLEANLEALRRHVPGVRFTVFSRDPDWSSRRYGVDAIEPPHPSGTGQERITEAIAGSNALLVSGGGNMCATWPDKIHERATLLQIARSLGRPAALVGQTLGPILSDEQRSLLADVLPWAGFVGVRDDSSAALAESLGVPRDRIHRQIDDAFLLTPDAVLDGRADVLAAETRPLIVVTLDASFGSPYRHEALRAIAGQLDALAALLGAVLVFVPHVGGEAVADTHADRTAGIALRDFLKAPIHLVDLWEPREVRWLIGRSSLVISSRYHPIVFAMAARVPSIGIHQDDYTRIKLTGALAPAGLAELDAAARRCRPRRAAAARRRGVSLPRRRRSGARGAA